MEQEHQDLVRAAAANPDLLDALTTCNDGVLFDGGWSILKGRFESLFHFIGGITSVLPGTDQVERNSFILKAEKDDFRTALTKILLGGVLHSNQSDMISFI